MSGSSPGPTSATRATRNSWRPKAFRCPRCSSTAGFVVEHRARKLGLGQYLNALAIGAAHHLGARAMIGTSGTKDGQDRFHERFGFRPVPGTRRYVPRYTEDVVIMFHRVLDGAGRQHDLVTRLRDEFPLIAASGPSPLLPAPRAPRAAPLTLTEAATPDRDVWRPVLFTAADHDALTRLLASGDVREVHDTLDEQLTELVRSREPACRDDAEIDRKKREQLTGVAAWEYGTWVWYPWSGRLVHVLPREEFRLVRTDRNRGRIERPEQRDLFGKRIGIIGLSVGNSAALTFALEGIGGAYRLADFDDFGLSNLNRLRGRRAPPRRQQGRALRAADVRDRPVPRHRDRARRADRGHHRGLLRRMGSTCSSRSATRRG